MIGMDTEGPASRCLEALARSAWYTGIELGQGKRSGELSYPDSRNASLVGERGIWNAVRSLRVQFRNGGLSRSGREGTIEPVMFHNVDYGEQPYHCLQCKHGGTASTASHCPGYCVMVDATEWSCRISDLTIDYILEQINTASNK